MDRNIFPPLDTSSVRVSLSARRAWIEIVALRAPGKPYQWSLSARRAWIEMANFCRNRFCPTSLSARRAWIEIRLADMSAAWNRLSLSARRAWIEIDFTGSAWVPEFVALRKESVDRNFWC